MSKFLKTKEEWKEWVKTHKWEVTGTVGAVIILGGAFIAVKKHRRIKIESIREISRNNSIRVDKGISNTLKIDEAMKEINEMDKLLDSSEVISIDSEKITKVKSFVRHLPEGQRHSSLKEIEASKLGIELSIDETIVDAHPRVIKIIPKVA